MTATVSPAALPAMPVGTRIPAKAARKALGRVVVLDACGMPAGGRLTAVHAAPPAGMHLTFEDSDITQDLIVSRVQPLVVIA